jgi:hypothetical protein
MSWIDVKEKLPPEEKVVLVLMSDDGRGIEGYLKNKIWYSGVFNTPIPWKPIYWKPKPTSR